MKRLKLFLVMAAVITAPAIAQELAGPEPESADHMDHAEAEPAAPKLPPAESTWRAEPAPPKPEPARTMHGKQTVAVYMAGEEPAGAQGVHKILGGELARTISTSEKYSAVDRTDAILLQLSREHTFQRSGAVSDEQIKSLGQQFGVSYLCISDITAVTGGSYYLDVRLVDVVTAEIIRSVTRDSYLRNADEMRRVAQDLAFQLIENERAREMLQQAQRQQQRKKNTLLLSAIGLDILGAGLIAYGIVENGNVANLISEKKFTASEKAETRRNAAIAVGSVILAAGITIHIFF